MPKVSLLKLIDEAVLPVVVIFGSKLLGLFFANNAFNLGGVFNSYDFSLTTPFFFYPSPTAARIASDFSTLVVYLVIALGFGWVVFRAHHFHLSHLHPTVAKRVFLHEKDFLLVNSYEIYHQAAIWLSLSSLFLINTFQEYLLKEVSLFVFSFAWVVVMGLILLLFIDLGNEAKTVRSKAKDR
jgi:hypothetical protein